MQINNLSLALYSVIFAVFAMKLAGKFKINYPRA